MKKKLIVSLLAYTFLMTACFEKETPVKGLSATHQTELNNKMIESKDLDPFPLSEEEELQLLEFNYGKDCFANTDCLADNANRLTDEFMFKRGRLILRGNKLFQKQNDQWALNQHLEVITDELNDKKLTSLQESDIHLYTEEKNTFRQLKEGVNTGLNKAFEPQIVAQNMLGMPALDFNDPNACNLIKVENFIAKNKSPWLPSSNTDFEGYAVGMGFNENTDTYAAETVVLCGGISLLNRTLKIEAKNLIFYNSHIRVISDRDMKTGLKIVAENIGYFGSNVIESNILDRVTGQKNSTAPDIDITLNGEINLIESDVPTDNMHNSHFLKIFMGENL